VVFQRLDRDVADWGGGGDRQRRLHVADDLRGGAAEGDGVAGNGLQRFVEDRRLACRFVEDRRLACRVVEDRRPACRFVEDRRLACRFVEDRRPACRFWGRLDDRRGRLCSIVTVVGEG